MPYLSLDEKIKNTMFAVQATRYEQLALWNENKDTVKWEEETEGFSDEVGEVAGNSVVFNASFAIINGVRVMFYYGCSRVVDYEMLEEGVMKYINHPTYGGTQDAHADAMNFGRCLAAIESKTLHKGGSW